MTTSTHPSVERLRLYEDWTRRLSDLADEMEHHFGSPGDNNQDVLDSAVHVACHIAIKETAYWRKVVTGREF